MRPLVLVFDVNETLIDTRPGNALLPVDELPQPTIVAADIGDLVDRLR